MTEQTDTLVSGTRSTVTLHEGGCLCGGVRFTVEGAPVSAAWCHCRECQRSSGSSAIPWGTWPIKSFRVIEGQNNVACFASSYRGNRHFCAVCGAALHMTNPTEEENPTVDVPLTALDDPAIAQPTCHGWVSEQVPWATASDNLPRHEKDVPE